MLGLIHLRLVFIPDACLGASRWAVPPTEGKTRTHWEAGVWENHYTTVMLGISWLIMWQQDICSPVFFVFCTRKQLNCNCSERFLPIFGIQREMTG